MPQMKCPICGGAHEASLFKFSAQDIQVVCCPEQRRGWLSAVESLETSRPDAPAHVAGSGVIKAIVPLGEMATRWEGAVQVLLALEAGTVGRCLMCGISAGDHATECRLDAALDAAGLGTAAERDEARDRMAP